MTPTFDEILGQELKSARKTVGWKVETLLQKIPCKVARTTWGSWENGTAPARLEAVWPALVAMEIPPGDFISQIFEIHEALRRGPAHDTLPQGESNSCPT